ncbi:MAG: hypothetical protein KO464_05540 [Candidatus Methanofastidiosum sp.]|nr:hypothetical protein [Methanofastidiosum sp.]
MTTKFFISFNPVPIQFHEIWDKEGRRIKAGAVFALNAEPGSRDDRLANKYVKMNTILAISEEEYKKYKLLRRGEIVAKEDEIRAKLNGKKAPGVPKPKIETKETPKVKA